MAAPPVSSQSSPHVEVRILGPFEVYRDGIRLPTDTWQRRIGRLFKLLVTAPDLRLRRDDLIDILWPESSPRTGASNLRLLVHLLRQSLAGSQAGESGSPGVLTHGGWVALSPGWVWEVDLDRFERLVQSDARRSREEAVAVYRSEPLIEDRYDDWAVPIRERVQRAWRVLCLELAHECTAAGSPQQAVQWLERILESDPLDEEALRELLNLLGQLGRRVEALQRYRQFERRLDEEMDLRPAQETFAVVDSLGASEDIQFLSSLQGGRIDLSRQIVPVTPTYPFPGSRNLIGREFQLRRLLHALDGDHEDRHGPRLLFIEAEAGMGKSHLLGEVAVQARAHGFITLAGGCYEQEGGLTYGPIHDALLDYLRTQPHALIELQLGDLISDLLRVIPEARGEAEELAPEQNKVGVDERLRLFSAIARVFERISADKPLVLLLDDLHWADDATLQLLHFLHRQNTLDRVSLVGAYRAEEVAEGMLLARLVSDVREMDPSRLLSLEPLSEPHFTAILEDRLGGPCADRLVTIIQARSAGNPFFAVQMARLLQQEGRISSGNGRWDLNAGADFDLPEAVRDAVERRLRQFDPAEREVLTLAAVLGREFEYPALESMWRGADDDLFAALDGAVNSQVLSESESGYVFRHPLLWEVVYQRVPVHRRSGLHRRALLALEAVYGDHVEDHATELAWHARASGDKQRALQYALQAGVRAAVAFAHEEAEQQYEAALDLARQLQDRAAEGAALEGVGQVLTVEGRFDEALELLEQGARARHDADDVAGEARAVTLLGWVYHFNGMRDTGWVRVRSFLDAAGEQLTPGTLAALHVVLCNLLVNEGTEEHLGVATQASKYARLAGHSGLLAEAEVTRGVVLSSLRRYDEALQALECAMPLAEKAGDLFALVRALLNSSRVHVDLGELDIAWLQAERGLELARREGHALQITAITNRLATIAFYRGDWDLAQQFWHEAVPMARSLGPSRVSADPLLGIGWLYTYQGRDDEAAQHLAEGIALAEPARVPAAVHAASLALAHQDLMNGNARAALERVAAFTGEYNAEFNREYTLLTVLALAHLALGDTTQAETLVRRGLEHATAQRERLGTADMLWLQGQIFAQRGRWQEAERALNQAISLARELPYPFAEAVALAALGTGYLEQEQRRSGQERLEAALAIFQRLQARAYVDQTRQILERLGSPGAEADVHGRQ